MDATKFLGGTFLKGVDLEPGKLTTLTIVGAEDRQIQQDRPAQIILSFHETTKTLPLNMTNLQALIDLFGADTDDWKDREIRVYPKKTQNPQGGTAIGVRIDDRPQQVAAPKNTPAARSDTPNETAPPIDGITDADIPF